MLRDNPVITSTSGRRKKRSSIMVFLAAVDERRYAAPIESRQRIFSCDINFLFNVKPKKRIFRVVLITTNFDRCRPPNHPSMRGAYRTDRSGRKPPPPCL